MKACIADVLRSSSVKPEHIVALGLDFTSCTIVPVVADGTPLCAQPAFRNHPDAWIHLWKDQTAQPEADYLTTLARKRQEPFLAWSGNKIAADTLYPKVLQIARRSPDVFQAVHRFVEAGDWVTWQLTGKMAGGASAAGYKALWNGTYPETFLRAADPNLATVAHNKLVTDLFVPGEAVGQLTPQAARDLGLTPGIAVASANIDAHASLPGSGVSEPGTMVVVLGTSLCHMVLTEDLHTVPGIVGAIRNGIVPGYVGYEAGQPAAGDLFAWYVENSLPEAYQQAARSENVSPYQYLEELAHQLLPGESGLLALDWWNGNRSPLANGDLSGLIVGYSLQTRPEHVFRALMEGVAFGTRLIIDAFETHGVTIDAVRACGGVAFKSPMMLQLLADITGRPISLASSPHASALGSAIMAAAAVGEGPAKERVQAAIRALVPPPTAVYHPNREAVAVYNTMFAVYRTLVDQFAMRDGVLDSLARIKKTQAQHTLDRRAQAAQQVGGLMGS